MGVTFGVGAARPLVLVGCVSQLYQGDLDLGRRAAKRLAAEDLRGTVVEDLFYGAVAAAQLLQDLRPDQLVLVGAEARGRAPGSVTRHVAERPAPDAVADAVECAVTGYVDIDLVVDVAAALDALPARVVAVEVEPASVAPSVRLSPLAAAGLEAAVELVRAEVRHAPALFAAREARRRLATRGAGHGARGSALTELLDAIDGLDRDGHFGAAFRCRDRLRLAISTETDTGDGDACDWDAFDWALWWSLIEELDQLQHHVSGGD